MHKIILTEIALSELLEQMKELIREEIAKIPNNSDLNTQKEGPITTKELCEYLRVTEPTIARWRKKGKIPSFEIGTAKRYILNEVLKSLSK